MMIDILYMLTLQQSYTGAQISIFLFADAFQFFSVKQIVYFLLICFIIAVIESQAVLLLLCFYANLNSCFTSNLLEYIRSPESHFM